MITSLFLAAALFASVPQPAAPPVAESVVPRPVVPVTFVVVDSFKTNPHVTAIVDRDPRVNADIIILRRDAITPELIFATLQAFVKDVDRVGATSPRHLMVYFNAPKHPHALGAMRRAFAERVVQRILAANVQTTAGVAGRHPATTVSVDSLPADSSH